MLKALILKNFRGFKDHRVELSRLSLLVGRNNAGKTTIIEALRILAAAQSRVPSAQFVPAPEWLAEYSPGAGFKISLETIEFEHENVQHNYSTDEPSIISGILSNSNRIDVYIGDERGEVFCRLFEKGKYPVLSRKASNALFHQSWVMPPVDHLQVNEKRLSEEYLKKNLNSNLSYRHIRNQMWDRPDEFQRFAKDLEDTWTGIQLGKIEQHGDRFNLTVREGPYLSEIGRVGHGLQAWAQTLWFLARIGKDATIVLDEPDVYLHADVQRKLIKLLANSGYRQVIVATHSTDIISDVSPQSVVVVQKRERISRAATSQPAVQRALEHLGTLHNIQLAKISKNAKVLFVEGKDKNFLSEIAYKISHRDYDKFSELSHFEIGGGGNWQRAIGAASALAETSGKPLNSTLILDSDYRSTVERNNIEERARKAGLNVKFWSYKEIENYFISADAIVRILRAEGAMEVSRQDVSDLISSICADMKPKLIQCWAETIQRERKQLTIQAALREAEEYIDAQVLQGRAIHTLLPGKEAISRLSETCQKQFGVSFGAMTLCRELAVHEVPVELRDTVRSLIN